MFCLGFSLPRAITSYYARRAKFKTWMVAGERGSEQEKESGSDGRLVFYV